MKRFKGGLRRLSAAVAKPENGAFAEAVKRKYASLHSLAQSSRPALVFRAVPTSSKRARAAQTPLERKRAHSAPPSRQPIGAPMRSEVRTIFKERVVERHTVVVREVERIVREQRTVREQAIQSPYAPAQPGSDVGRRAPDRETMDAARAGERGVSRQQEVGGGERKPQNNNGRESERQKQQARRPDTDIRGRGQQDRRPHARDKAAPRQHNRPSALDRREGEQTGERDGQSVVTPQERTDEESVVQNGFDSNESPPQSERFINIDPHLDVEWTERRHGNEQPVQKVNGYRRVDGLHADAKPNLPNATQHRGRGSAKAAADTGRWRARVLQRNTASGSSLSSKRLRKPTPIKSGIALSAPAVRQLLNRLVAGPAGMGLSAVRQLTLSSAGFVHARVRRQRRDAVPAQERTADMRPSAHTADAGRTSPPMDTEQRRGVQPTPSNVHRAPGSAPVAGQDRRDDSIPALPSERDPRGTAPPDVRQNDVPRPDVNPVGPAEAKTGAGSNASTGGVVQRVEADRNAENVYDAASSAQPVDFKGSTRLQRTADKKLFERRAPDGSEFGPTSSDLGNDISASNTELALDSESHRDAGLEEQAILWPYRLSLFARAAGREALNRETLNQETEHGLGVLVHNIARRALVPGASSTRLNRTYGSRWQPVGAEAPDLRSDEPTARAAKIYDENERTQGLRKALTDLPEPSANTVNERAVIDENARNRTASSRLSGSIYARRHQSPMTYELQDELQASNAQSPKGSSQSPRSLRRLPSEAADRSKVAAVTMLPSGSRILFKAAGIRSLDTAVLNESGQKSLAAALVFKRHARLGLPAEGQAIDIRRVDRQDRIQASNLPQKANGRTHAGRNASGNESRLQTELGSAAQASQLKGSASLQADAPRLVFKLGAVRSLSSDRADGSPTEAGRFRATGTPSAKARLRSQAANGTGRSEGGNTPFKALIPDVRLPYRGSALQSGVRHVKAGFEQHQSMTITTSRDVAKRHRLRTAGAAKVIEAGKTDRSAGERRPSPSIQRHKLSDSDRVASGVRPAVLHRNIPDASFVDVSATRLTLRDRKRPVDVQSAAFAAQVEPPSQNVAVQLSGEAVNLSSELASRTSVAWTAHPRSPGDGEVGFAHVNERVVLARQSDSRQKGHAVEAAAAFSADSRPAQRAARLLIAHDETKSRQARREEPGRQGSGAGRLQAATIEHRTRNFRKASSSQAAQRIARNSAMPSVSTARTPLATRSPLAQPDRGHSIERSAQSAQRIAQKAPSRQSTSQASSTELAALRPLTSTGTLKADGSRAPIDARLSVGARSPSVAARSLVTAHSPVASGERAGSSSAAIAQATRAASVNAAPADSAPAAVLQLRGEQRAGAPNAQSAPSPAAELRLRRAQQAGASEAQPSPVAELELRRTPKASAPAQPPQTQPAAQEPPRLSAEQLQQAVREMPELDPERLADTVYTALMRRMKFEQRLSGY